MTDLKITDFDRYERFHAYAAFYMANDLTMPRKMYKSYKKANNWFGGSLRGASRGRSGSAQFSKQKAEGHIDDFNYAAREDIDEMSRQNNHDFMSDILQYAADSRKSRDT